MKIELTIPTSLDEIPLLHYQKFMEVSKNSNDDEFTAQKMIQIFCGIELKEVVKIAFNDMVDLVNHFNKLFSEIPKLKPTFKIKDLELGMIPNFDKITWEEYIELESQFKDFDTFHKAMAVLYRPVIEKNKKGQYLIAPFNNVEEFSDLMKYTPLSVALSSHVFFWNLERELLTATLNYLEIQMKKLNKNNKTILAKKINLANNGDGISQFMQSQKEILQDLMKSSELNYLPYLTF
ncbi:hypothetical protein UFOVP523_17 [uncultured Caudovirales phage]|uniref:Uncharacterized protein n=1 Tax=uncultured Caudovirales phage TaxID=2100421 RepID=A0A6J5MQF8_9CAUD|nr:hypothetical protein UFOVP523_17 [uncultured Caudovirales phage]